MTGNTKYVSATELADYFGVSKALIFARVTAGDIPKSAYLRMGRIFRFDLAAVEAALRSTAEPENAQLEFDFESADDNMENYE
jgi:predicted DNA-binding transcriptional regulator AlpA